MIALVTIYDRLDDKLVLRNNFVQEIAPCDLKEFLTDYIDDLELLNYTTKSVEIILERNKHTNIIELEKEFVFHIRFVK